MVVARPRRDFDPRMTARYGRPTFSPKKLVKYSTRWGFTRLFNFPFSGSCWRPRMNFIVIAVDGACKVNNLSDIKSKAAYGVYFGPRSNHNQCGRIQDDAPQSNSRAELEAVRQALLEVVRMRSDGVLNAFKFVEVIIKTDSTYVHNVFNDWIWTWLENGFLKSDGKSVQHQDLITEIHNIIRRMEKSRGTAVRFWRVDREWNVEADELANLGLSKH